MSRRDRVLAALRRQPVDRVPYAFWRHFPQVDRNPAGLAQATLRFQERYGSDFIKITPAGGYAVEEWGCVEGDVVHSERVEAVAEGVGAFGLGEGWGRDGGERDLVGDRLAVGGAEDAARAGDGGLGGEGADGVHGPVGRGFG